MTPVPALAAERTALSRRPRRSRSVPPRWAGMLVPPANPRSSPSCIGWSSGDHALRRALRGACRNDARGAQPALPRRLPRRGDVVRRPRPARAPDRARPGRRIDCCPGRPRTHARACAIAAASPCRPRAAPSPMRSALDARACACSRPIRMAHRRGRGYWRAGRPRSRAGGQGLGTFRAYELREDEVPPRSREVDQRSVDATVMSGTGMLTLPAILRRVRDCRKPILSSNLCSAWWLLRTRRSAPAPHCSPPRPRARRRLHAPTHDRFARTRPDRRQAGPLAGFAARSRHRERASRTLARGVSSSPRVTQRPVPLVIASAKARTSPTSMANLHRLLDGLRSAHPRPHAAGRSWRPCNARWRTACVPAPCIAREAELAERIARSCPARESARSCRAARRPCQLARAYRARGDRPAAHREVPLPLSRLVGRIHLASQPGRDGPTTGGPGSRGARERDRARLGRRRQRSQRADVSEIAAVIMEPAAINAGCFAPPEGFLARVRELTRRTARS